MREQLCAEPTGRQGDPGAISAYCSSGCSKVLVLPSASKEQGPGLETSVVFNTYAIALLSRHKAGTRQLHPKPVRPLGNGVRYWFATNLAPDTEEGP